MVVVKQAPAPQTISLLEIQLSLCDSEQLLQIVHQAIQQQEKALILSGNVQAFNLAHQHPWLRDFFNRATVVRIDGAGVRLGARLLGHVTPHRMTWADFAWEVAEQAARHGHTLFLLGARPGVAQKAAQRLQSQCPNLQIVGVHHGYFDKQWGSVENEEIIQTINDTNPDILIVGFGMPVQERWLMENGEKLNAPVVFTGGAVFDYISGELQRAPRWMTRNGLEWLGRLLVEPGRLWTRYILGNPLFLWRILKQRVGLIHFHSE